VDTIINQKGKDLYCIVRRPSASAAARLPVWWRCWKISARWEYTTIVVASAAEAAALQYVAPCSGCAIGEWFMENGKDALVVYDRSVEARLGVSRSVAADAPSPGREAYPGDVFYLHSAACWSARRKLSDKDCGGGSA
jgi:F-type H+-transporting ATPase subunit alpha